MAECVVSPVLDADTNQLFWACMVHTAWAPCPLNGQPANPTPVELTNDTGRVAAFRMWEERTRRQRPLVLHHGSWADDRDHDGSACWCQSETFPAVEVCPGG